MIFVMVKDLQIQKQVILRELSNQVVNARPSPNVGQDVPAIQDQVAIAGNMGVKPRYCSIYLNYFNLILAGASPGEVNITS